MNTTVTPPGSAVERQIERFRDNFRIVCEQVSRVIVGNEDNIVGIMTCLLARGHVLLEGIPGIGKTKLVQTLADVLHLKFSRIQFTPDLMPGDILGNTVVRENEAGRKSLEFQRGPIFANLVLADEINRATPKTQSALLEGMQENSVSAGGTTHPLEQPFFVLATQNPLDQEGTYPLPEAQLDRFFFKIFVNYPSDEEELEIMKRITMPGQAQTKPVLNAEQINLLQEIVLRVPVADHVFAYAKKLVRSTRPAMGEAPDFIKNWINWGAGPRASIFLILAGKARAILNGQFHVACEDIEAIAPAVLRHRMACNFTAQAEGITTDKVIEKLLQAVPKTAKLTTAPVAG